MITEEQIKNLKPGDPLIINGTFVDLDDEGDIEIKISYRLNSREIKDSVYGSPSCVSLPSEHGASVPTPKHDPRRLFKEGDRAQVVERNGRPLTCFPVGRIKVGDIVTVAENENGDVFIKVLTEDGHEMMVPWFMLELVTPVEELGPYEVRHNEAHAAWSIYGPFDLSAVNYFYGEHYPYTKDTAKKAAEAERDRLNAEWRKEQNHD